MQNAEAAMQHGADVKDIIDEPMKGIMEVLYLIYISYFQAVGAGNFKLNVVGPAAELEKLKPKLAPRGAVFWELDSSAFWM